MAKKSKRAASTSAASKKPATSKPAAKAPAKSAPKKKSPPKKPAAAPVPALSEEQIGHTAGEVWGVLHSGGPMTIAAVKKAVPRPGDSVLMAIGWLAREGKLAYDSSGRSVKVALK